MGRKLQDLTGTKFQMLTAVECVQGSGTGPDGKRQQTKWLCLCECGSYAIVEAGALKRGQKSCGCLNEPHGLSRHPLYVTWRNIRQRCTNEASFNYEDYGGRGITLFEEWVASPTEFIAYVETELGPMWGCSLSIDRIDNDKGYEPGNIRWATDSEQQSNKRITKLITYNGKSLTVKQWCQHLNLPYITTHARLHRYGWTVEQAFTIPTEGKHRKVAVSGGDASGMNNAQNTRQGI